MSDFVDYNNAVYPPDVSPVRVSGRSSIRAKDEETFEILKAPGPSEPMKIRVENNRPLHITYVPPERKILQDLIAEIQALRRYNFVDQQLLAVPIDRAEARLKGLTDE